MRYQDAVTSSAIAARRDRVLRGAVKLDQTIDGGPTTAARTASAARFAHLVPAPRAGIDATTNRVIVDRMTVAHQHG